MSKLFDIHPLVVDKDIATALGLNEPKIVYHYINCRAILNEKENFAIIYI